MTENLEPPQLTAEELSRVVSIFDFSVKLRLGDNTEGPILNELAKAFGATLTHKMDSLFGVLDRKIYRLGQCVEIRPLPFPHSYSETRTVRKDLATKYGYIAIVSSPDLFVTEFHFIERDSFSLVKAVEHFSKLSVLK